MRSDPIVTRIEWLVVLSVTLLATVSCGPCEFASATCDTAVVVVSSSNADLLGATGCGRVAKCYGSSPCKSLDIYPPLDGGVCTSQIEFADGAERPVTIDWGAAHPGGCCGPSYDFAGGVVDVTGDAGK